MHRLSRLLLLFLPAAVVAVVATSVLPAAGADPTDTPMRTPWVNGTVWDVEVHPDGTIYFGGDFADVEGAPRSNIAALRPDGTLHTGFAPQVNGIVKALELDESGKRLFIGGEFTEIDGTPRAHLGAVRAWNGSVIDDWVADANGHVLQLELEGFDLYVGGEFTEIDGAPIRRLAAISVWAGQVRRWFHPWPNWTVQELSLSADGERLYAGGNFNQVRGQAREGLVEIDTATGLPTDWAPEVGGAAVVGLHVSAHDDIVYVATWNNRLRAYDPTASTDSLWSLQSGGDVQAILATPTHLHVGGHFSQFKGLGPARGAATIELATRELTSWYPDIGGTLGVWAIKDSPLGLVLGGDWYYAGGVYQRGLAVFPEA